MYATITTLAFKSPENLRTAVANLETLLAEARRLPGFSALYAIRTADDAATLVTLYASEEAAEAASAQLRPRLAEAVGPHVTSAPGRVAGEVLLGR